MKQREGGRERERGEGGRREGGREREGREGEGEGEKGERGGEGREKGREGEVGQSSWYRALPSHCNEVEVETSTLSSTAGQPLVLP